MKLETKEVNRYHNLEEYKNINIRIIYNKNMDKSIPNAISSRGNSMGMNITISVLIFFTILAIW